MQRGHAALVHGVGFRAHLDEVRNRASLPVPIPIGSTGSPVCGVVERLGTPPVPSADIGPARHEQFRESSMVRGGGDVQGGVPRVDVVMNRPKEVRVGILPGRTGAKGRGDEARIFRYRPLDAGLIARADSSKEREQGMVVRPIAQTSLRHPDRFV